MRSHTKRTKRLFELLGHLTRVRFRGNEPARVEWEIQPRNWGCHQSTRTDPQHHSMDVALEQVMELSRVASDCHEGLPASVLGFVSICACGWMEPPLSSIVIALCPSFLHSFIHTYIHTSIRAHHHCYDLVHPLVLTLTKTRDRSALGGFVLSVCLLDCLF